MKRIISLLLTVLMIFTSMPAVTFAAEAEPCIVTVETVNGAPGITVDVSVIVENNPGILGMTMKLEYDESALTLVEATSGEAFEPLKMTPPKTYKSGCNFVWYADDIDSSDIADGSILNLSFTVSEDVVFGEEFDITVTCQSGNVFDVDLETVEVVTVGGAVCVMYVPGDVSGDDHVAANDLILLSRYMADGNMNNNADGYNVNINELAADVDESNSIAAKDLILISRFISDGCVTDPDGYNVELKPSLQAAHKHTLEYFAAKDATCTEEGNIEYWYCTDCENYYADEKGKNKISIEDTVLEETGHTYSDVWSSDSDYHWHTSTCGHEEIADKAEHKFNSNNVCSICSYVKDVTVKLETPSITKIEYDTVYWSSVPNAKSYTVVINDNYERTLKGTSCSIKEVFWEGNSINKHGNIRVSVRAEGYDNYISSEWSDEDDSYYYVPETEIKEDKITADNFKIGYGYNLIEHPYLRVKEYGSTSSVFNTNKLFTVGGLKITQGTEYTGYGYYYESVDDYLSKTSVSVDFGTEVGCQLIGSVKTQFEIDASVDYSTHEYNCTYVGKHEMNDKNYYIGDVLTEELYHCLSDNFIKDVKGQTNDTTGKSDEEIVAYLYDKYGTHAILGVRTGGEYSASYTVQTNDEKIAAKVKLAFDVSTGGGAIDQIIQKNFNFGADLEEEIENNTSKTKTSFVTYYYGGSGSITTNMTDYSKAQTSWSVNENNASSIGFTKDGAIAISSLIASIDYDLSKVFEKYISERAEDSYYALYSKYTMPSTLPMTVEMIDGKNVLRIDLSSYQSSGNLENVYSPTLRSGILSVSPIMLGKRIDKIVIKSSFANGEADTNTLIDSFAIALTKEWSRDVDVTIENLGVVCASSNGFVDTSAVSKNIDVNISYKGTNVLKEYGDIYYFHSVVDSEYYGFAFDLDGEDMIVLDNLVLGRLTLPIAKKSTEDYSFEFAGWLDENNEVVTDSNGEFVDNYELDSYIPILHAKWNPKTFKVILNSQNANKTGTERLFVLYNEGTFEDFEGTKPIEKIEVPERTGYVFDGYYSYVENNGSAMANGGAKFIDADGYITSDAVFESAITLYALWKPIVSVVSMYDRETLLGRYYQQYGVGIFADSECVAVCNNITPPSREGYIFTGFIDDENVEYVNEDGEIIAIKNNNYKTLLSNKEIYAQWEPITYTVMYLPNGGFGEMTPSTHTYDVKKKLTDNTFTRNGYAFDNWKSNNTYYDDEAVVENLTDKNEAVVEMVAQWKPNNYTVTYNANGGSGTMVPSKHTYDVEKTLTKNAFERNGYVFAGWNTDPNGKGTSYGDEEVVSNLVEKDGQNIVLYADWSKGEYTVKFDGNGGIVSPTTKKVTFGTEYGELPIPTRDGYKFQKWTYNGDAIIAEDIVNVGGNHTLIASWEPNNYTVIYNANGGSGTMVPSKHTYDVEKALTKNAFIRDGYDFKTWNTDLNELGVTYEDEAIVGNLTTDKDGSVILYAQWNVKEFKLTYDAIPNVNITVKRTKSTYKNAITDVILTSGATIYYGDVLSITYTAYANYALETNGETSINVTRNVTSDDICATATGETYIVEYDLNASSIKTTPKCSSTSKNVRYNEKYGDLPTPTAPYYTFDGWYTAEKGGTKVDSDTKVEVSETKEHTLYAHWRKEWNGDDYSAYTYVGTTDDFKTIGSNLSGKYLIVKNIDVSSVSTFGSFNGILNGGGNTISGWSYYQNKVGNVGLFSENNGTITNLKINNFKITTHQSADITGSLYAGLLCGKNKNKISDITITSSTIHVDVGGVEKVGENYIWVGMVCGYNQGTVENTTVNGTSSTSDIEIRADVSSKHSGHAEVFAGGITGYSSNTLSSCTVDSCRIESTANGTSDYFLGCRAHSGIRARTGGIVGHTQSGKIEYCVSKNNTMISTCGRYCSCTSNFLCAAAGLVGHTEGGNTTLTSNNVTNYSVSAKYYDRETEKTGYCATGHHIGTSA